MGMSSSTEHPGATPTISTSRPSKRAQHRTSQLQDRVLDLAIALCAILFLAPLLVLVAMSIWAADRGPPIFSQHRIGRHGKSFRCFKFRSMVVNADARLARHLAENEQAALEWATSHKLKDDPRITFLGRFLRKSSIDELPQLFNVLTGSMSLVGPRPIVENEIARYGHYYPHYCSVKPGMTGLWQVSGRSDVSYRRRVVLDLVYSRSKSLSLDLAILSRTIPVVLWSRGGY